MCLKCALDEDAAEDKMESGGSIAPENEEPFVDNPILQARRRAFDHPTHENLCRLTDVVHNDIRRLFHDLLLIERTRRFKAEKEARESEQIIQDMHNIISKYVAS